MKKQYKSNGIVGTIEEIGDFTYSIRVEDDDYYYLDVIIQVQDGELVAMHNCSALCRVINHLQGFLIMNIDTSLNMKTRATLSEKLFNGFYQLISHEQHTQPS